jgi:hypothetical protein
MPLSGTSDYLSWKYKVYIQDDDNCWVDFSSDTDGILGADALIDCNGMSYEYENGILEPVFTTSLNSIVLNNENNWLDGADFAPKYPGGLQTLSSKYGNGGSLNTTTNQYLILPASDKLLLGNFCTITFWFNIRTPLTNGVVTGLISNYISSPERPLKIFLYGQTATHAHIAVDRQFIGATANDTVELAGDFNPYSQQWIHVTYRSMTLTNSNVFIHYLYINGNCVDVNTITGVTAKPTTANWKVNKYGGSYYGIDGGYDEIKFYDRALSYNEIISDYNNGMGRKGKCNDTGLIAGYHFDGDYTDYSDNNLDATNVDCTLSIEGKVGEYHNRANFLLSKSKTTKAWKGRKVKIAIQSIRKDGTKDIDELGQFYIKSTENQGFTKVLNLESESQKLKNRDASVVTNGGSWYENANYRFIIEKLLRAEMTTSGDNTLPSTYILPTLIERPTRETILQRRGEYSSVLDTRALSLLGRPPEMYSTTNEVYVHTGGICTAQCLWSYNTGTITVNGTVVTGTGTYWTTRNTTTLRPTAGDCMILTDTLYGNMGYYEIQSVDSDTQITLKTPVKGKTPESAKSGSSYFLNYAIVRIYMAIAYYGARTDGVSGDKVSWELYKYIPGLDKYVYLTRSFVDSTRLTPSAIYRLNLINVTPYGADDTILKGISFEDILRGDFTHTDRRTGYGGDINFNVSSGEISEAIISALTQYFDTFYHHPVTGFFHYRRGVRYIKELPVGYFTSVNTFIGSQITEDGDCIEGGEHICIPFSQSVGDPGSHLYYQNIVKYPNFIYGSPQYQGEDIDNGALIFNEYYSEFEGHHYHDGLIKYPDSSGTYSWTRGIPQLKRNIGYHAAQTRPINDDYYNQSIFGYSSGQKGAFTVLKGMISASNAAIKAGGSFYYIYDCQSDFDWDTAFSDAKSLLVTPSWTDGTCSTEDTLYFFSQGLKYAEGGEAGNCYNCMHPTHIENIDGSSELVISFMQFDDSNTPNEKIYPWSNHTYSRVYHCKWNIAAASTSYNAGFINNDTTTAVWNPNGGGTIAVTTGSKFKVGDIIRIDGSQGGIGIHIAYARIIAISSNDLTVVNADSVAGGNPTTYTFDTGSKVNIVAREVFKSTTGGEFRYITILESKKVNTPDGYKIWLSFLRRDKIGTSRQYGVGYVDAASENVATMTSLTSVTYHSNQPEGLITSVNELSFGYPYLYFMCGGLLYSKEYNNSLHIKGNGFKPVDSEGFISGQLVLDPVTRKYTNIMSKIINKTYVDTDIIYGISAPSPPHYTQGNTPTFGRYYLFKYDTYMAVRVPLADFSDMNVWEALGYMAQKANHLIGFHNGNFYCIPREDVTDTYEDADFTFYYEDGESESDVFEIESIDFGEEDIINIVSCTPSKSSLKEPEVTLTFQARGQMNAYGEIKEKYEPNVEVTVNQRDTLAKNIKLSCVNSCFISDATRNMEIGYNDVALRFRYLITRKTWETTLYQATSRDNISNNAYLYISDGATNIEAGDTIEIHIPIDSENAYIGYYTVSEKPLVYDASIGKVHVFDSDDWFPLGLSTSETIPAGTSIIVRPSNKWSDYNYNWIKNGDFEDWLVATGNPDWDALEDWALGGDADVSAETQILNHGAKCIKMFGRSLISAPHIYQTMTVKANTIYSFSIFTKGPNSYVTFADKSGGAATTTLKTGSRGSLTEPVSNNKWEEIRGTVITTGTQLQINLFGAMGNTENIVYTYYDHVLLVEGDLIRQDYLKIAQHDTFYQIGDSNVYIKFSDANEGQLIESDSQETKFLSGDMIEINCEGLTLETFDTAKQVARNETSVRKYGKLDKDFDNPFLNFYEARELVSDVVDLYSNPYRIVTLRCKMKPGLSFINSSTRRPVKRVDIKSSMHFPLDPNNTFRGRIMSIKYGKTYIDMELRSLLVT